MDSGRRADALLGELYGSAATFRDGQREAILAVADERARLLVVQRTGWGKSLVYFLATRLLRERGSGPTLIVSPLLSLMDDQARMARRLGVRSARIASDNTGDWDAVEAGLRHGDVDILFVSPERLANERFRRHTLPRCVGRIGLLVVDEAHCISDWGHDFRPDYRRIVGVVRNLPTTVPVLGTTATANDRVVADISEQLGPNLRVVRGALARRTLRLQATPIPDPADRLAWLAGTLPTLPGSGIVYALTVADSESIAAWLRTRGIAAAAYHGNVSTPDRRRLEHDLRQNRVKALVATVALGMGFDKPDLGFVVHYQRPGSLVAYYQQIGRAGRAIDEAFAILLQGSEDDDIQEHFIAQAFPTAEEQAAVLGTLERQGPLSLDAIQFSVNRSRGRISAALKFFEVEGLVARDGRRWIRTPLRWSPDRERSDHVTRLRRHELGAMQAFVQHRGCLMQFVVDALDDAASGPCGRCSSCRGQPIVPESVDPAVSAEARRFLRFRDVWIHPRQRLPGVTLPGAPWSTIPEPLRVRNGRALCHWGDGGWGALVRDGKYRTGRFDPALVEAAAQLVRERWRPQPPPAWITSAPSTRHGALLDDFARRLAAALELPYVASLRKIRHGPPQKDMANSVVQAENVVGSLAVLPGSVGSGPVLLVDDMVDSGWTMTAAGLTLLQAGSGPVHPFALAKVRE